MKLNLYKYTLLICLITNGCAPKIATLTPNTSSSLVLHPSSFSLDELQHRTFNYFWDLADAHQQIPDRYPNLQFSSIAATGFGLTAYLIGVERKYISRKQAAERTLKTLQALINLPQGAAATGVSGYKGLFYHFLDHKNSLRYRDVELSTIDTGLLMAGILSAQSYFDQDNPAETQIRTLADTLFRRVEWDWSMGTNQNVMSMGWKPENGFIPAKWIGYNEAMVLVIMAMGSPTHPLPATAWQGWTSGYKWNKYRGQEYVDFAPLFGHQYSQMYIDFKGIQDDYMAKKGIDYFENSRRATLTNKAYCLANPQAYPNYADNEWGLTACDGPKDTTATDPNGKTRKYQGYSARGASSTEENDDGTIAPTAAAGSLPFAPEICLPVLKNLWTKYQTNLVGKYGFKDAYNPTFTYGIANESGWFDPDYLGIDQGPIIIQIENYRSQFVWNLMKKNKYITTGLKKAGFKGGWLDK